MIQNLASLVLQFKCRLLHVISGGVLHIDFMGGWGNLKILFLFYILIE